MADFGGMSADQINASMGFGPGGVGAQGQAQLNNNFGNFGQQTDDDSGLGAAYAPATGGFNGPDQGPLNPVYGGGGNSVFDTGAAAVPYTDTRDRIAQAIMAQQGGWGNAPTNATPSPQGLLGYTPSAPGAQLPNGFGYPGAMPPSQMFNPNTYAPPQQQSSSGGGLTPKTAGYDDSWMRGGGVTPVGMDYSPRGGGTDMSPGQFQALKGLQNPQLNFPMPIISNDFYTSTTPGFGSRDRFNMQTTQPPEPLPGGDGLPPFGGNGLIIGPYPSDHPQVQEGRS
jgi:hypothetical protein